MAAHSKSTHELTPAKLFDLTGQVALVTGGGTGIGLMAAQGLAAAGAKVYITGRREDALARAAESHAGQYQLIPLPGDIGSKESVSALAKDFSAKEEVLDILINNAGINSPTREVEKGEYSADELAKELWKDSFEDWAQVYNTNVVGQYFVAVAFMPLLSRATAKAQGRSASIVNISSISGITSTSQHHLPYNVSKAATIQLTKMLAQEFSQTAVKVRVNSIAPGIFPSEMTASDSSDQQKSHVDASGYREEKKIPAGRPGNDADMAQSILFAVSNNYLNGEIIVVDGGYLLKHP